MTFSLSINEFKKFVVFLMCAIFLACAHLPKAHASINVDGSLADWQITPGTFGNSDWVPGSGIAYTQEDQTGSLSDFLNPGWGGQLFDAEALYYKKEGSTAYFALVTGFPFTGASGYEFGDIAFDFGSNGSYEFGLETRGNNGFIKGDLYGNATWIDPLFTTSKPYDLNAGSLIGAVSYATSTIVLPQDTHYLVEIGIPIDLFGAFWSSSAYDNPAFSVHWTMGCGNDVIDLPLPEQDRTVETPEPPSLVLLLMGFGFLSLLSKYYLPLPVRNKH